MLCSPLHCNPPRLSHNRNIKVIFLRSDAVLWRMSQVTGSHESWTSSPASHVCHPSLRLLTVRAEGERRQAVTLPVTFPGRNLWLVNVHPEVSNLCVCSTQLLNTHTHTHTHSPLYALTNLHSLTLSWALLVDVIPSYYSLHASYSNVPPRVSVAVIFALHHTYILQLKPPLESLLKGTAARTASTREKKTKNT